MIGMANRFLQITDVAEILNISVRQTYSLVTTGELPAIKVGRSWRIESDELEKYIQRAYAHTREQVDNGSLAEDPEFRDSET